jgi:hypothetical protein
MRTTWRSRFSRSVKAPGFEPSENRLSLPEKRQSDARLPLFSSMNAVLLDA